MIVLRELLTVLGRDAYRIWSARLDSNGDVDFIKRLTGKVYKEDIPARYYSCEVICIDTNQDYKDRVTIDIAIKED